MDRRQQVLKAAIDVLAEAGSRGLTHRAVDQRAGMPTGSTSNLYRTRAALIGAVVDGLLSDDEAQLTGIATALRGGGDVGVFLAEFIGRTIRTRHDETRARFALLADPEAKALVDGRARLVGYLDRQVRAAGRDIAPQSISLALALGDGVMMDAVLFRAPFDEAVVAAAINRILAPLAR